MKKAYFEVLIGEDDTFVVCVIHDHPVAFEAHAIVAIEAMKEFCDVSHGDAVDEYTKNTKRVSEFGMAVGDVIAVRPLEGEVYKADMTFDDREIVDIEEYWTSA